VIFFNENDEMDGFRILTYTCVHRQQAGEDWNETRLLCVSAGWGNGGYLVVGANGAIHIGPGGVEGKQKADLWRIEEEHLVLDER
jgi:hypothetical protein